MKRLIQILFLMLIFQISFGQDIENDTIKIKAFHYVLTGAGISSASYRDMGVSPLVYSGYMPVFSIAHKATKPQYIWDASIEYAFGSYNRNISNKNYSTSANNVFVQMNYLRNITSEPDAVLIWMIGAGLSHNTSVRVSPHYMNSQFVMDNFSSLSINGRVQYDFSLKAKEKKIWFLNCIRPERHYTFGIKLDVPFGTMIHRPGFSYVSHATTNEINEFDDYKWHLLLFTGVRAKLELLRFLENGNAVGISYHFNLFSSKQFLNQYLQMADQSLQLSLLYRFK